MDKEYLVTGNNGEFDLMASLSGVANIAVPELSKTMPVAVQSLMVSQALLPSIKDRDVAAMVLLSAISAHNAHMAGQAQAPRQAPPTPAPNNPPEQTKSLPQGKNIIPVEYKNGKLREVPM